MTTNLTAAQIRARLTSEDNIYGPPGTQDNDAWGEVFAALSNDGLNHLIAWTYAQEGHDSRNGFGSDIFTPEEFAESFERTYQQAWETPAAFAEHVTEEEANCGTRQEARGRAWFLENYGEFINFAAFAASPKITNTYELIMLDAKNSREVHAFQMGA